MYFENLLEILLEKNPKHKIEKFYIFYEQFKAEKINFESDFIPPILEVPSYNDFTIQILPKEAKKREKLHTIEGKQNLLHTIAHIEYSAIDLALDASLRFANMPKQFYIDWLEVADDEIRHFVMISSLLNELGISYGDLPIHTNLFLAMQKTPTLLERMAIVPRYLEANGLEQNPNIIKKLSGTPDAFNKKIEIALAIILEEEINHVKKGDYWFKYECDKLGLNPEITYFKILEKFYPGSTKKNLELNFKARKEAGFSCFELKQLSKKNECD